ncbi:hypothetical protein IFM89_004103 [Coptis chinensis]|uniref:Uncharacterized protein n=1 Tax=Coptis chinensis TaxID=261450 RepID=A0A835H380_9MAGN|nr:hypothetical protein IFM89_004103 [Coptis chinensis]
MFYPPSNNECICLVSWIGAMVRMEKKAKIVLQDEIIEKILTLLHVKSLLQFRDRSHLFSSIASPLGFMYPVRSYFLEDVLEMTGYKLTSFNQIDDFVSVKKEEKSQLHFARGVLSPSSARADYSNLIKLLSNGTDVLAVLFSLF